MAGELSILRTSFLPLSRRDIRNSHIPPQDRLRQHLISSPNLELALPLATAPGAARHNEANIAKRAAMSKSVPTPAFAFSLDAKRPRARQ
jgi:hypothetical protein